MLAKLLPQLRSSREAHRAIFLTLFLWRDVQPVVLQTSVQSGMSVHHSSDLYVLGGHPPNCPPKILGFGSFMPHQITEVILVMLLLSSSAINPDDHILIHVYALVCPFSSREVLWRRHGQRLYLFCFPQWQDDVSHQKRANSNSQFKLKCSVEV